MNKHLKEQMVPLISFIVAGLLLFIGTFGQKWTYDDHMVIVRNLDIRSLENFFRDTYPGLHGRDRGARLPECPDWDIGFWRQRVFRYERRPTDLSGGRSS